MRFGRITSNPAQMGGVPCIRGLRIPVATIIGLLAQGMSGAQVLADYPDLEPEDMGGSTPLCGCGSCRGNCRGS